MSPVYAWLPAALLGGLAGGYLAGARAGERRARATPGTLSHAVRLLLARGHALGFSPFAPEGAAARPPRAGAPPAPSAWSGSGDLTDEVERFAYWVEDQWRRSEEERRRLTVVLAGMTEGVLLLDRYGRVLLTNAVAESLWPGLHPRLLGRRQIELFQDAELDRALTRTLFRGVPQEVEVARPAAAPGAAPRFWRVRIQPLRPEPASAEAPGSEDVDPTGAVMVVEDVTGRRDMERMRRDFVANVSHELQTPLTSIRGYAETLQDEELDQDDRGRFLARILEQTGRMTALVHDLLSLAALEAPRFAPAEPVAVAELVREVAGEYASDAERAGVALSVDVAPSAGAARVSGRAGELRLAVGNLVRNALTYTPGGGSVLLEVARGGHPEPRGGAGGPAVRPLDAATAQDPAGGPWIQIRVADTGVGIPADALPRVFERFYRVDPARTRATGGTGLGLAIVKHAVVGHGGVVEVESRLGQGSTFTIRLPAADAAPPPGPSDAV